MKPSSSFMLMVVMRLALVLAVRKGTSRSYGRRHLSPLESLVATLVMLDPVRVYRLRLRAWRVRFRW